MSEAVLVVDDDGYEVTYLEQLIASCGFVVQRARFWSEALALLRGGSFRAMFLDLNLGAGPHDGFVLMDRMEKEGLQIPTQIVSRSADLIGVTTACARYPFVTRRPIPKQDLYAYRQFLESFLRESQAPRAVACNKRDVFLVYGRNRTQLDRVASIVSDLGLDPVVLQRTEKKGRTLIELVEQHGSGAAYAVVLLTGDDIGYLKTDESAKKPRARQNVILELGFFFGRLGRDHVMCLVEPGVERPSDIDGIFYEDLSKPNHELERSIIRELKALKIEFEIV